jgi:hypothetical protein
MPDTAQPGDFERKRGHRDIYSHPPDNQREVLALTKAQG